MSKNDIHKADRRLVRQLSQNSLSERSQRSVKPVNEKTESLCDIESPVITKTIGSDSSSDEGEENRVVELFEDTDEIVYMPLQGQKADSEITTRRQVPNGCAICLCSFDPDEKVTWSFNGECSHVFHHDCVVHWFLAVGRKVQRKFRRQNPQMTDEEALDMICKFPMLCPCCRQPFCKASDDHEKSVATIASTSSTSTPSEPPNGGQSIEIPAGNTEPDLGTTVPSSTPIQSQVENTNGASREASVEEGSC